MLGPQSLANLDSNRKGRLAAPRAGVWIMLAERERGAADQRDGSPMGLDRHRNDPLLEECVLDIAPVLHRAGKSCHKLWVRGRRRRASTPLPPSNPQRCQRLGNLIAILNLQPQTLAQPQIPPEALHLGVDMNSVEVGRHVLQPTLPHLCDRVSQSAPAPSVQRPASR